MPDDDDRDPWDCPVCGRELELETSGGGHLTMQYMLSCPYCGFDEYVDEEWLEETWNEPH